MTLVEQFTGKNLNRYMGPGSKARQAVSPIIFGCLGVTFVILVIAASWPHVYHNAGDAVRISSGSIRRHGGLNAASAAEIGNRYVRKTSERDARELSLEIDRSPLTRCENIVRYGNPGDGGWDVCQDHLFPSHDEIDYRREHNRKDNGEKCIIYSFGINDDPSFDLDMQNNAKCKVYAFDHTISNDFGRKIGPKVKFHPIGLADGEYRNKKGAKLMSLRAIMDMLGHKKIDVLKMDIEMSEWKVWKQWFAELEQPIANGSSIHGYGFLKNPPFRQLLAEIHFGEHPPEWYHEIFDHMQEYGWRVFSRTDNWRFCKWLPVSQLKGKRNTGKVSGSKSEEEVGGSYNCLEVGWLTNSATELYKEKEVRD